MKSRREQYRKVCETHPEIPIFQKDWWLDAVCGRNAWGVALAGDHANIWGALPFYSQRRFGLSILKMPVLTQTLGVWIRYPSQQKYASRLSHEKKVCRELIEELPSYDVFRQNFHPSFSNWLPFYWADFQQTTRYTYIIEPLEDLEEVFGAFESSVRNKIRKARDIVDVSKGIPDRSIYDLVEKTFRRQGEEVPYEFEAFERIARATRQRGRSESFGAIDDSGNLHSSLFLIWDDQSSYLHILGEDPELRRSGAGILLAWDAIKYTKEVLELERFDFVGSMIEPIERVRRSFGARQTRYFRIRKSSRRVRLLKGCRKAWRAVFPGE